jgi:hypothetical protein
MKRTVDDRFEYRHGPSGIEVWRLGEYVGVAQRAVRTPSRRRSEGGYLAGGSYCETLTEAAEVLVTHRVDERRPETERMHPPRASEIEPCSLQDAPPEILRREPTPDHVPVADSVVRVVERGDETHEPEWRGWLRDENRKRMKRAVRAAKRAAQREGRCSFGTLGDLLLTAGQ